LDPLPAGGAEEGDLRDGGEALPQARDAGRRFGACVVRQVAGARSEGLLREPAALGAERAIVGLPCAREELAQLSVVQAVDEARLAERSIAAVFADLPEDPFEVLA